MPIEHRYKGSVALKGAVNALSLCHAWLTPLEQKFTWLRNNPSSVCGVSKSRLDRFCVNSSIMSSIQTGHIVPCSLSDHSAVTLVVRLPSKNQPGSAYWHFNNSLLDDKHYRNIVTQFWTDWRTKRCDFPSFASWWDFGKSHIKSLSCSHTLPDSVNGRPTVRMRFLSVSRRICAHIIC